MKRWRTMVGVAVVLLAVLALVLVACQPAPLVQPVQPQTGDDAGIDREDTRSYNAACYREQQTGNFVCAGVDDATFGGLYPALNATAGQMVEFGSTGAAAAKAVTPVAITTVTAYGCTVNSPTAAAQLCYAVESGGVLTFTIMSAAATPAAIVTPHAAGASFWIGGN